MNNNTTMFKALLEQLAQSMGLSVVEYVQGGFVDLTTYGQDKASILARLDAIDVVDSGDSVETLAEKIIAINEVLSNDQGELQGILDLITTNTNAIANLTNIANVRYDSILSAQTIQDGRLTDNTNAITVNTAAIDALQTATGANLSALQDRVVIAEALLTTLRGDSSVAGSVANSVLAEETRAKAVSGLLANLNTSDKATLVAAINEVNNKTQANAADITALGDLASAGSDALAQEVIDRTAADTALENAANALSALVADLTTALAAETQSRTDGDAANAAAIAAEASRAADAEADLQEQVNALGGSGSGSLGDLENRMDAVEDELNDTTDADDNLVKGLKTKVADNAAAITALEQSTGSALTTGIQEAKDYSDARDLNAGEVDACAIGNIFRTALGLADNTCGDQGSSPDGDGAVL
jgi:hypothetical protein